MANTTRYFIHDNRFTGRFEVLSGHSGMGAKVLKTFATNKEAVAFIEGLQSKVKSVSPTYTPSMAKHEAGMARLRKVAQKQKNPAKTKRRSLKNPALDYGDEATASELASYMHSVYKNGKALRAHLKKIAKTSAYSEAKYIAFLVKSHLPTVAVEYYRNARDAKQYATANVKKRAAELFIEDTLDGSYD